MLSCSLWSALDQRTTCAAICAFRPNKPSGAQAATAGTEEDDALVSPLPLAAAGVPSLALMISASFYSPDIFAHSAEEVPGGFNEVENFRAPEASISYHRIEVLPPRVYVLHLYLFPPSSV